jgi:hypothetical protein
VISNIKDRLIKFGRHPKFQVWKGQGPIDDSNEEWATSAQRDTHVGVIQMDKGVHMETMLEHLVQPTQVMNGPQQT